METVETNKKVSLLKAILFWILFYVLFIASTSQSGAVFSNHVHRFVSGIAGTAIVLIITWLFIKSENKTLADYGLVLGKTTFIKFFRGLAIGIIAITPIIILSVLFAGLEIQRNPEGYNLWTPIMYLAIVPAAFMEEIAYRAYPFIKLNKAFGLRITQLIVLIAFALHHIPLGWGLLGAFTGQGVWALIFGIAAVRSKGIALPTGIHVGTNLVQSIMGMNKGVDSFWLASQNDNTNNLIAQLVIRFLVLLVGLFLTEYYIRKSNEHQKV